MASRSNMLSEEANTLLEHLTKDQRDYLLSRLVTEKLDDEYQLASIPVHRADDGKLLGHIRRLMPPSGEDQALMNDRARRVDPRAGRPTRELLERMKAGDVESVRKFIH